MNTFPFSVVVHQMRMFWIMPTRKRSRGIVLYRLSGLNNQDKAEIILSVFENKKLDLASNFTVVIKSQIRVKKLLI